MYVKFLIPENFRHRILQVMFDEQAGEVIRTASCRGISMCYYRHKMMHMDRACDAPLEICMTFNNAAYSLVRHGHAREVDVAECLDLPDKSRHLEALASKFS